MSNNPKEDKAGNFGLDVLGGAVVGAAFFAGLVYIHNTLAIHLDPSTTIPPEVVYENIRYALPMGSVIGALVGLIRHFSKYRKINNQ